jgi:hypothetical protein
MGGFRSFANDINLKAPTSTTMPTFDNYKGAALMSTRKKSILGREGGD